GGETPICSNAEVTKKIDPEIITRFREQGILYMRNLNDKLGLAWQKVFQTNDPKEVENYCTENNMNFEWKSKDNLSIKWKRPALLIHPLTKEELWFNHGFFFNRWALSSSYADAFSSSDLPFNTFYGNGEEIEKNVIENIAAAFENTKSIFKWEKNDVLVLDNMRMAHGRNAFTGSRKILVSMSSAY
ncbi:MAG: TauD/TfdA family dioxygenase, partial [Bacteroidia bacterium]|nr:TauD/TfdA family dioxygenase [Bacteroidia bacterium]